MTKTRTKPDASTKGRDAPDPQAEAEAARRRAAWRENWSKRWGEAINAQRRERYDTDDSYRERMRAAGREAYRKRAGGTLTRMPDCRENLSILDSIGTVRPTYIGGMIEAELTFTLDEAAEALGQSKSGLTKWRTDGSIPEPVLEADIQYVPYKGPAVRRGRVYSLPEMVAMIEIIGEHRVRVAYLRREHTETLNAIRDAVAHARKEYGIE